MGRTLAYSSSVLRMWSKLPLRRSTLGMASNSGPPVAPNKMASASCRAFSVAGGSTAPVRR